MKILSFLFIFLIPFYDVPRTVREGVAFSGILGVVLLIFIFYKLLMGQSKKLVIPVLLVFPFLCFLVIYTASTLINSNYIGEKSLNHIVFYAYTFLVYTIINFFIMRIYGTTWYAQIVSYSTIVISLIGFYEMSLYYTQGWDAYSSFLDHGDNVGIFGGFPRLRSTFNEPSHYSLYMVCIFPILLEAKKYKGLTLGIISSIITFSASFFTGIILATSVYIPGLILRLKIKNTLIYILAAPLALWAFFSYIFEPLVSKVMNVQISDPYRYTAWNRALEIIPISPWYGYGAASYYSDSEALEWGVFNWYLQLILESGILGLLAILVVLWITAWFGIKAKVTGSLFCVLAFSGAMISMNHYYIPGFWTLMAFVVAREQEIKNSKKIEPYHYNQSSVKSV